MYAGETISGLLYCFSNKLEFVEKFDTKAEIIDGLYYCGIKLDNDMVMLPLCFAHELSMS